jgi:hypothetical protein
MSENQKDPQYKLRWNEELRDKVMNSAKENNRSINQEIIARLEESLDPKEKIDISNKVHVTLFIDHDIDAPYGIGFGESHLYLQFEPNRIPVKGDLLEVDTMEGGSVMLEVAKRIINTQSSNYYQVILKMTKPQ